MALELAKDQTIIVMFFENPPQLCIEYDKLFRQAAALDRSLRWDTIKEDVYVWSITQRHSFREKSSISSRLGPPNTDTTKPPDRTTHTATGKEICKRFNHNRCTRGSECIFAPRLLAPRLPGFAPWSRVPQEGVSSSDLTPQRILTLRRSHNTHHTKDKKPSQQTLSSRVNSFSRA